jgi:GDP-fucose protein O-fucosyltransferase
MYLLGKAGSKNALHLGFIDFFDLQSLAMNEAGLEIISMDEFLKREGLAGKLKDRHGEVTYPPDNRTNYDADDEAAAYGLWPWLQSIAYDPSWNPEECMAAFASNPKDTDSLQRMWDDIEYNGGFPSSDTFVGKPVKVYAPPEERLKENIRERKSLCVYDQTMHQEKLIHFHGKRSEHARLLVHFYAFLFFEDWRQDLWTKRFVRDRIRYKDSIQCAASRVIDAVHTRARDRDPMNPDGEYDAFHIRRGDFQYKKTRVSAEEIYDISKDEIPLGSTVYIATDEQDKSFFKPMANSYDLVYLDDFRHLLVGIDSHYYGMIDQLVASRSRTFFGCWFSTFTAYINRLRGYHSDRLRSPGFVQGIIDSFYYAPADRRDNMREYWPVSGAFYAREFPVSWRNIDQGVVTVSA